MRVHRLGSQKMTRKLSILVLAFVCCLGGASAAINPGVISGTVRNSSGVPNGRRRGTSGQLHASQPDCAHEHQRDLHHPRPAAGRLYRKVSAPSFLPTIREHVRLQSGASLLINVTLNTLFEAIQLVPKRKVSASDDDDWRWALRSMANRPILRLADDDPLVVVQKCESGGDGHSRHGCRFYLLNRRRLLEQFRYKHEFSGPAVSIFGKRSLTPAKWSLNGGLGSNTNPNAVIRAAYAREMWDGSSPESRLHRQALCLDQPRSARHPGSCALRSPTP